LSRADPVKLLLLIGLLMLLAGCRPAVEPFKQTADPGEIIYFAPNTKKMVALTFDDGPNGSATEQILDSLKKYNVKASFFLVGANAERYPQIAKRIMAEGHLIGNHTYRHSRFDLITPPEIEQDVAKGAFSIENITGHKPAWLRPPYGINGAGLEAACRRQGCAIAGWSLDANDWNPHPVEDLVDAIADQATAGDIILLHDGFETSINPDRQATVAAVPLIVEKLQKAGFIFVTLADLLRNAGAPAAVFENGVRLLGVQVGAKPVRPGGEFAMRYFWDVPETLVGNLPSAFVHFTLPKSNYFFQGDYPLCRKGDVRDLVVRRLVHAPKNAPEGKYEIRMGLFPPGQIDPESRLTLRSNFPQAQRAVYLPEGVQVASPVEKTCPP